MLIYTANKLLTLMKIKNPTLWIILLRVFVNEINRPLPRSTNSSCTFYFIPAKGSKVGEIPQANRILRHNRV